MNLKMKKVISTFLFLLLLIQFNNTMASNPFENWDRSDVLDYFETNDIIFEGEYNNDSNQQNVLIGRLNSNSEIVRLNFFISDGKFVKALITTTENKTFQSLHTRIEDQGFKKVSESNDKLGNQYRKYQSGEIELTVVNKTADWPEIYFQP